MSLADFSYRLIEEILINFESNEDLELRLVCRRWDAIIESKIFLFEFDFMFDGGTTIKKYGKFYWDFKTSTTILSDLNYAKNYFPRARKITLSLLGVCIFCDTAKELLHYFSDRGVEINAKVAPEFFDRSLSLNFNSLEMRLTAEQLGSFLESADHPNLSKLVVSFDVENEDILPKIIYGISQMFKKLELLSLNLGVPEGNPLVLDILPKIHSLRNIELAVSTAWKRTPEISHLMDCPSTAVPLCLLRIAGERLSEFSLGPCELAMIENSFPHVDLTGVKTVVYRFSNTSNVKLGHVFPMAQYLHCKGKRSGNYIWESSLSHIPDPIPVKWLTFDCNPGSTLVLDYNKIWPTVTVFTFTSQPDLADQILNWMAKSLPCLATLSLDVPFSHDIDLTFLKSSHTLPALQKLKSYGNLPTDFLLHLVEIAPCLTYIESYMTQEANQELCRRQNLFVVGYAYIEPKVSYLLHWYVLT